MNGNKTRKRLEWAYSFDTSRKWLVAVKVDKTGSELTQEAYAKGLHDYCQWLGKTPDRLIEERKAQVKSDDPAVQHEAEEELRAFCAWLERERRLQKSTIANLYSAVVRSFYRHHYYPLKLRSPKYVNREIRPHTLEEIRKMLAMVDPRERAILLILKDSGLSRADFCALTYGDVKRELEAGNDVVHVKLVRKKGLIPYDTFLGKNAVQQLRAYLQLREQRGEKLTERSPLITTEKAFGRPMTCKNLSVIFDRISKRTGVATSPHKLRKTFQSYMGLSAPTLLTRYWMGHSLGLESRYFIPVLEKQREKYVEAYREIDVEQEAATETTLELSLASLLASLHGKPASQQRELVASYLDTLPPRIRQTVEPKLRTKLKSYGIDAIFASDTATDCQHIIDESELERYLANGYRFVSTLSSGKVVVDSNHT